MTDPCRGRRRRFPLAGAVVLVVILAVAGCTWPRPRRVVPWRPTVPSTTPAPPTSSPAGPGAIPGRGGAFAPDEIEPGVVHVNTRQPGAIGAGTGMVLTADGTILTNNHVIDGAMTIIVTVPATGQSFRARVLGTEPTEDVAVIQADGASGLATIPVGDSDTVQVGDAVAAVGNALGQGGIPTVAPGRVVALHRRITAADQNGANRETLPDTIQVDAEVLPGHSGGALIDAGRNVVGMTTAASAARSRYATAPHEAFAIPINRALAIARRLAPTALAGLPAAAAA